MNISEEMAAIIVDVETAHTVEQVKFILARAPDYVKNDGYFALQMILQGPWVVEFFSDKLKSSKAIAERAIKKNPRALTYFNNDIRKNVGFLLVMIEQNAEVFKHIDVDIKNNTKNLALMFETNMNIYEFLQDDHKNEIKLFKHIMTKPNGAKQFKHAGPIVRANQQIVEYIAENEQSMLVFSLWLPKEIILQIFSRFNIFQHREYFDVCKNMPKELLDDKEVALCIVDRDAELYNLFTHNIRHDWDVIATACNKDPNIILSIPEIVINNNDFILHILKYFENRNYLNIVLEGLTKRIDFGEKQELISLLLLQEYPHIAEYLTPVNQIQNKKLIVSAICQKKCFIYDLCKELQEDVDFICSILDVWHDFRVPYKLENLSPIVKKQLKFGVRAFNNLSMLLQSYPDICLVAVKINGKDLKYVPDSNKTHRVVFNAIRNNPEALRFSGKFREDADYVRMATKKNPKVHKYIGSGLRSNKLFLRTLPETVPILGVASRRLKRAGINYIWFDDDMLNHTQPYLPPEIQRQVLSWII